MSVRRRFRKLCVWGSLLILAVLVGGAIAAYHTAMDSDTLAGLIRREAPRYLPGCRVEVLDVRVRPFLGDIKLSQLRVYESEADPSPQVAGASRVVIRYDPWAMTKGRLDVREVVLSKPVLQLRRLEDGSWNVQGLLADPWPGPKGGALPLITVQDGVIELSEDDAPTRLTLLRDVALTIPAAPGLRGPVAFSMDAKGEYFERVHLEGSVDPSNGRVQIKGGSLVRLDLSESLRARLPRPARDALKIAGLTGGEVDATLSGLSFDPSSEPRLRYAATARLARGTWACPKLPFPVGDVSIAAEVRDGRLTIARASGVDGVTSFVLKGWAEVGDPSTTPFEALLTATNLELDNRLRRFTPPKHQELWDLYFPEVARGTTASAGRVNVSMAMARKAPGGELSAEADVKAVDVSVKYRHFAYKVDHVKGDLKVSRKKLILDLTAPVGTGNLTVDGEVDDPGPNAVARLNFEVDALPVDEVLFNALPKDVQPVVNDFKPTGVVRGRAKLRRDPPLKPGDDPRGLVAFDAWVDLIPGCCSITWKELKYPVRNLTGKLEIHPNRWIFQNMKGNNGQAEITASGGVKQVRKKEFKVDLALAARNLPFDQQLREALPRPWQVTWSTLNPTGASDIDATIDVDPDRPKPEHDRIEIRPLAQSGVKLRITREPVPGVDPGGKFDLQMDDATGRFVYDSANSPPTVMSDVGFTFHGSPVTFKVGQVDVKDSGEFNLGVRHLEVRCLRLDEGLRRLMPPVMAQAARRLDDRQISKITTDLGLGWSGKPGDSPWCQWRDATVFLTADNKLEIGADLGLDHIQGELAPVEGSFDGRDLRVHGGLNLDSVSILGQQVTGLKAELDVKEGFARIEGIRGTVLGGAIAGHVRASLDATPRYSVALSIERADLHEYAKVLKGHQTFKGLVTGYFDVSGLGYDPHTISGRGQAKVVRGDLGELPVALRFVNVLKLAKETKRAFDEAEVEFRIHNGQTSVDKLNLTGNAFSLNGRGSIDVRGELALRLQIIPGRDNFHVPVLSDLTRELSGQLLVVRVDGPIAAPSFRPDPIPLTGEMFRRKPARPIGSRTGLEPRLREGIASRWFGLSR